VTGNTFNADNEMTAFNGTPMTYDANGNLLNDGTNTYAWDMRNHLSAITGANTASFVYDPFGRRISKTIGSTATSFLSDGLNPVQELQSGSPSASMLTGLGIDEYFQRTDASGASSYLTDALDSTLALANSAGGLATSYTYDPFGNTAVAGSGTNPFQFTGRENDGTGLYFYRARYYSPTFQRFVAQDPIGFRGGDLDLYSYVSNNPATFTDPTGRAFLNCLEQLAELLRLVNKLGKRIQERKNTPPECQDYNHQKSIDQLKKSVTKQARITQSACARDMAALAELEALLNELEEWGYPIMLE